MGGNFSIGKFERIACQWISHSKSKTAKSIAYKIDRSRKVVLFTSEKVRHVAKALGSLAAHIRLGRACMKL